MVLKGSIGTFDIISIIQMVTSQQVTGMLHIQGPDKNDIFEIMIENGMIVRAVPMTEAPARYSAQRLHKAGLLGSGQLKVLMAGIKKEDINEADIPKSTIKLRKIYPKSIIKLRKIYSWNLSTVKGPWTAFIS